MNDSFLLNIANYIKANQLLKNDTLVVLPSKRSGLFLKQSLINIVDKASFLPQFLSISEFLNTLTDLTLLDNVHLQFELYKAYKSVVVKEKQDSFEKFVQWAPIVLQDFNDIDNYLVNPCKIYDNLSAVKRLEEWFPNNEPTELSKNYLHFFEILKDLYSKFYNQLLTKQEAYQGMMYREAVKNSIVYSNQVQGKIIFAGFNALNKAEEIIIQELLSQNKAKIFWDIDQKLIEINHPAAKFIQHYKKTWPYYKSEPLNWVSSNLVTPKNINIIGVAKQVGQFKIAGKILNNNAGNLSSATNTALVLSDENLLDLALESLPENIDKVNITMGYPLENSNLASLFTNVFKAQIKAHSLGLKEGIFFTDFEQIYQHPFFVKLSDSHSYNVIDRLKNNHINIVEASLLNGYGFDIKNTYLLLESDFSRVSQFLEQAQTILCRASQNEKYSELEQEYILRFYSLFTELADLESRFKYFTDLNVLYHFYLNLLNHEKLFFKGEPLSGLQIMGLLETRNLDFENLIITSVNERIMPKSKSSQSFLPFSIKKAFGLPTYQDNDSIFAYHFFRLIQRAKNIYLIYNTEVDDFGASEKSRFITQLELFNSSSVSNFLASTPIESKKVGAIKIATNQNVLDDLKNLAIKGLSPSAIALFLRDPIAFYFSKVLKIKEVELLESVIAQNIFGTVVHDALHDLYLPFKGQLLTDKNLNSCIENIEIALNSNLKKSYKNGQMEVGKNKLYFEMAKQYIIKLIHHELDLIKKGHRIKIIDLEKPLETNLEIEGLPFLIKLHGIADRIDQFDGKIRIIDYKTGAVDQSKLKINNIALLGQNVNYEKALQLLIYAFIYAKSQHINTEFEAGIISFKNLNNYVLKLSFEVDKRIDFNISTHRLREFEPILKSLIKNILTTKTFIENDD